MLSFNDEMKSKYILIIDVGSTYIKVSLFNYNLGLMNLIKDKIIYEINNIKEVVISPITLINQLERMIDNLLKSCSYVYTDLIGIAISNQRSSFLLWDRNGPVSPIISWKDKRCEAHMNKWNNSFAIKSLKHLSSCLNSFKKSNTLLSGKHFKFKHQMASIKLNWYLTTNRDLKSGDQIYFGTIDCWLIWHFSQGKYHLTDATNASSTGIYHPDSKNWYKPLIHILKLNSISFPRIINTFCFDDNIRISVNGHSLRLLSLCADQQASAYGSLCFDKFDVKVTLGTGIFVDCNTGSTIFYSDELYPIIGWRNKMNEDIYFVENNTFEISWLIEKTLDLNIVESYNEFNEISSTYKCYFNDKYSYIISQQDFDKLINASLDKEHVVFTIIETIAFYTKYSIDILKNKLQISISSIKIDGGISRINKVIELIADLLQINIHRSVCSETTTIGMGLIAMKSIDEQTSKSIMEKLLTYDFIKFKSNLLLQSKYAEWIKLKNDTI